MRRYIVFIITIFFFLSSSCASAHYETTAKQHYAVASWYGPDFHGRPTASGEIYDMNAFTCAHREYPFGTKLKITYLSTDRTTNCLVNDSGPPLVVIESLACGCRVVTTDLPGLDAWIPEGLCAEGLVERVPLPRLIGPDTPVAEDLPAFVEELAAALGLQLARSLECGRASEAICRLAPLSWREVIEKMHSDYRQLAGLAKSGDG